MKKAIAEKLDDKNSVDRYLYNICNVYLNTGEYQKAKEYTKDYILTIILNLNDTPKIVTVDNPVNCLAFEEVIRKPEEIKEYHLVSKIC